MTYKAGDLVYFDDGVQKGVGKIVSQHEDDTYNYLVHSTQIAGGHNGNNWFLSDKYLKPFTKKVGQKYKVIHNSVEDVEVRIGDIITLDSVEDDKLSYYCNKDVFNFLMYDLDHSNCEVEFYEDAQSAKENEMFTKDDLQVGYLVRLRNRQIAHVVNTDKKGMCLNYVDSWDRLDNYNRDLTNAKVDFLDIDEVYGYTLCGYEAHKFEVDNRELLWEREEVKEMTIEDIQKALGHKIKVVE